MITVTQYATTSCYWLYRTVSTGVIQIAEVDACQRIGSKIIGCNVVTTMRTRPRQPLRIIKRLMPVRRHVGNVADAVLPMPSVLTPGV